jgi:hypothetical protein
MITFCAAQRKYFKDRALIALKSQDIVAILKRCLCHASCEEKQEARHTASSALTR